MSRPEKYEMYTDHNSLFMFFGTYLIYLYIHEVKTYKFVTLNDIHCIISLCGIHYKFEILFILFLLHQFSYENIITEIISRLSETFQNYFPQKTDLFIIEK